MSVIRKWLSRRAPWVFENSKIPGWLSKIVPIEINAVSILFFVFCRGDLSKTSRRHETIHYIQQLEMLFLFHWVTYLFYFLWGFLKNRSFVKAYKENPFEKEAYSNQRKTTYLVKRPLYNWRNYR
tara:strand:+ start:348 stop:722 length:375 start_codon:yes stop_codon:yes gene_type:complete